MRRVGTHRQGFYDYLKKGARFSCIGIGFDAGTKTK
jgi:hypothetical protein